MKAIEGWESINEAGEIKRLPAGPQICKIIEVVDKPDLQYHEVFFDIDEGEFKGYFNLLQANTGKNHGVIRKSYKPNALPFFKGYITAVVRSNPGYQWNWDEKGLSGKRCVIVFRDEEYEKDGEVKVMAKAYDIRSIQALQDGLIKTPPMLKLEKAPASATVDYSSVVIPNGDDLPF